jgi:endonuclease III
MSSSINKKDTIRRLMKEWGGRFSSELGIDIDSGSPGEVFKWFLASILFGARIRQSAAMQTYREFEKRGVLTPDAILKTGWDGLVQILDAGGYARYDFKTATKLLGIAEMVNNRHGGDLNRLHEEARDAGDLESKLMEFKGVGEVTVNIFLREMRGIWQKADPLPGDTVIIAARELGFTSLEGHADEEKRIILDELKRLWEQAALPFRFSDFEAALVRFGIELRRKK